MNLYAAFLGVIRQQELGLPVLLLAPARVHAAQAAVRLCLKRENCECWRSKIAAYAQRCALRISLWLTAAFYRFLHRVSKANWNHLRWRSWFVTVIYCFQGGRRDGNRTHNPRLRRSTPGACPALPPFPFEYFPPVFMRVPASPPLLPSPIVYCGDSPQFSPLSPPKSPTVFWPEFCADIAPGTFQDRAASGVRVSSARAHRRQGGPTRTRVGVSSRRMNACRCCFVAGRPSEVCQHTQARVPSAQAPRALAPEANRSLHRFP